MVYPDPAAPCALCGEGVVKKTTHTPKTFIAMINYDNNNFYDFRRNSIINSSGRDGPTLPNHSP